MDNKKKLTDPIKVEAEKEPMVPVSMLQTLMDELADLKKGQIKLENKANKGEEESEKVAENVMRLLEYKDKLVVSFNKKRGTWKQWDKERREEKIFMEIMLQDEKGEKETAEVDYMDLMDEGKLIDCDVVDTKITPTKKEGKMIRVREVIDFKTVETKNKVRQVVKSQDVIVVLKVPAPYNTTVTLNTEYVNIK